MSGQASERWIDAGGAETTTLSGLLGHVGTELAVLTRTLGEMQNGLSPLLMDAAVRHPETYCYAQQLDLVWQTLQSLAQVMTHIAGQKVGHHVIDVDAAVAGLPLADVAQRLRGLASDACDDDLDLF